jgi:hypothetical protein
MFKALRERSQVVLRLMGIEATPKNCGLDIGLDSFAVHSI